MYVLSTAMLMNAGLYEQSDIHETVSGAEFRDAFRVCPGDRIEGVKE